MKKALLATLGLILIIAAVSGYIGTRLIGIEGIVGTTGFTSTIHLITGVVMLVISFAAPSKIVVTSKILGILFLLLSLFGLIAGPVGISSLLYTNLTGNTFNLLIGLSLLVLAFSKFAVNRDDESRHMVM
jgi:hypothetical protein